MRPGIVPEGEEEDEERMRMRPGIKPGEAKKDEAGQEAEEEEGG